MTQSETNFCPRCGKPVWRCGTDEKEAIMSICKRGDAWYIDIAETNFY